MKNYLDRYLEEHGTTRYKVSKVTGILPNTLQNQANSSKGTDNITGKVIKAVAVTLNKTPGEVFDELVEFEEELKMEKLLEIFSNYGIKADLLDYIENGKINLGEVEPLDEIIKVINNGTTYTAFYSNDFDGGLIIEGL